MTGCIHCHMRRRERGLYCARCHDDALARAATRPRERRRLVPGVQRQKFDDHTCPCWAPAMNNRGAHQESER